MSGRSREAIRPELKSLVYLHSWTWTLRDALTQQAMELAETKVSRLKSWVTCGGLVTAK